MKEFNSYVYPISQRKKKKDMISRAYSNTFKISQSVIKKDQSLNWKANITNWFCAFKLNSTLVTFIVKNKKLYGRAWSLKSIADD